jgi:hypothetical protein
VQAVSTCPERDEGNKKKGGSAMCSEYNQKKEDATCCDPGDFQGMSEMMGKCFSGENTLFTVL